MITSDEVSIVEWEEWECPTCGDENEDPDYVFETTCSKGHSVKLNWTREGLSSVEHLIL